jgi:glycosyltransferase involved in cell wall biosynthesis
MDPFEKLPPVAKEPISVALPVRDQVGSVSAAVAAWCDYLDHLGQGYELIAVDDGSTDGSAARLEELAARRPRLRLLRHEAPRGFGAAVRTALAEAKHPLFFYTALDFPYAPGDLRKLLDRINDVHLVSGFRAHRPPPAWAVWLGRFRRMALRVFLGLSAEPAPGWLGGKAAAWAWLNRLLFGVRLHDIDSAFKLFRRSVFSRLPIQSDGDFVHAEMLAKANFLGCLMDELPVAGRPGPFPAAPAPPAGPSKAADLRRVFARPEFGPYVPEPAPAPAPQVGQ